MSIQFSMPTKLSELPAAIQDIRGQIAIANAHVEALKGILKALQGMCPHKNKHTSRDIDGVSDTMCNDCGKYGVY